MMSSKIMLAILALSIALAGCLGGGTDHANGDVSGQAGGTGEGTNDQGGTDPDAADDAPLDEPEPFERIETVRVNFPLSPADPAPAGPTVDVPDNTAVLKFEISWHSTTGHMVWSSAAPPPATESVGMQLDWPDGVHAATVELGSVLRGSVGPPTPGGAFGTQTETLPLNPARGGTLTFSPTGWGDLWAVVHVSARHVPSTDGQLETNARDAPADQTVPEGNEPTLTVIDMSGELPATSVGVYGLGPAFDAGTVPSGEDADGTVLIDFQPDLGPAALEAWICIGTFRGTEGGVMIPNCQNYVYSTGQAVQLNATGLSDETILVGTLEGGGSGTNYVLCASVFDFHVPAEDYTAIVDGHCRYPNVVDMSGELLAPSAGVFGVGNIVDVGTVPPGGDDAGTVLIDFQPDLGPGALSVSLCIAADSAQGALNCEAWDYSTGGAVQLDATGLYGKTIFLRTDYGAGSGTTYVLCASAFGFHEAPDGYSAIVDGRCHGLAVGQGEQRNEDLVALAGTAHGDVPPELALAALAAMSVLTLGYAGYYWPLLKYVASRAALPILGYAKVGKDEVLNHETRDKLLQTIRAEPGVSPPELHRSVGGGWSTVVYHLGVLEKNGLVTSLIDGRHKRFFPADSIDFGRRDELAALANARTKAAYDLVRAKPGIIQKSIARHLGIAPQSTSWHLRRLEQVGLLEHDRAGRKTHYYAKPAAHVSQQ